MPAKTENDTSASFEQLLRQRPYHRQPMRVAWDDTDASGRIHFTAAFRWAEQTEHGLLRSLGFHYFGGFPRRKVEATYHLPLTFEDCFDLSLLAELIGTTSIVYRWEATNEQKLFIEGRYTAVHVNYAGQSCPVPDDLKHALSTL